MRRSSLAALLIAVACAAAGCGVVKTHNAKITLQSTPPVHLAVIPKSVGLDYWSKVHAGAECAASQMPGVKVTWNGVTDETDVVGQNENDVGFSLGGACCDGVVHRS